MGSLLHNTSAKWGFNRLKIIVPRARVNKVSTQKYRVYCGRSQNQVLLIRLSRLGRLRLWPRSYTTHKRWGRVVTATAARDQKKRHRGDPRCLFSVFSYDVSRHSVAMCDPSVAMEKICEMSGACGTLTTSSGSKVCSRLWHSALNP